MAHSKLYQKIMNSKEWKELNALKIRANPLCERCLSMGWYVPGRCTHHIQPIESGRTEAECWEIALRWSNLQRLCFACHSEIHKAERYHDSQTVRDRQATRQATWEDQMLKRFDCQAKSEDNPQEENGGVPD